MKYDMRHSITLQKRVSTQNPIGNRNESYVDVATFKAAYVPNTGRMYLGAAQLHTETDCEFQMRYSSIPQQGMYILFNGNRYLLQTPVNVGGLNRTLRLLCKLEK